MILAYLWKESGWELVEQVLAADAGFISTVNASEVACKALEKGLSEVECRLVFDNLGLQVVDFDSEQAWRAASLRLATRSSGLSLGDRACLALAQSRGMAALTADQCWLDLNLGIQVEHIRASSRPPD